MTRAFAILLLTTTAAIAQGIMPTTVPLTSNQTGEVIGTATISGNSMYLRKTNGELIATVVRNSDGSKTLYDPDGKVLDRIEGVGKLPQ